MEEHHLATGGEVTYVMTGPAGKQSRGWWQVTSADPPRSLEFTDGFANQDGTPNAEMPTALHIRPTEHYGGTRMRIRSVCQSREHMEQVDRLGAIETFRQTVGQMDDLLVD